MVVDSDKKFDDRLVNAIMDSIVYASNEARILHQSEQFFSPRPASFCDSEEKEKALHLRISRITKQLVALR
jgi:hypothetical protein